METLYRKCFVLREIQIPMEELIKGDVFRLEKASTLDCLDENKYSIATEDGKTAPEPMNAEVKAEGLEFKIIPYNSIRIAKYENSN